MRIPACVWTVDEDGVYDTACGNRWEFNTGTPAKNGARFCMYCGGALVDSAMLAPVYAHVCRVADKNGDEQQCEACEADAALARDDESRRNWCED